MPNPNDYKESEKQKFMSDCMHQCVRIENKSQEESVAQCLSMWREKGKKKKKCASELIREQSNRILSLCSE